MRGMTRADPTGACPIQACPTQGYLILAPIQGQTEARVDRRPAMRPRRCAVRSPMPVTQRSTVVHVLREQSVSRISACRYAPHGCPMNACGNGVDDGCGGTINCGGCGNGQTCRNSQCVCQPQSCGNRCGNNISDGCGGTLNCSCGQGQRCQSGMCQRCGQTSTNYHFPTTVSVESVGGLPRWFNSLNVRQEDGQFATASVRATPGFSQCNSNGEATIRSGAIQVGGFGFNIPSDATIDGITVQMRWRSRTQGEQWLVEPIQITRGSTASSNMGSWRPTISSTSNWTNSARGQNYERWGLSWTPAQINRFDFTTRFEVRATVDCMGDERSTLEVDRIAIKI